MRLAEFGNRTKLPTTKIVHRGSKEWSLISSRDSRGTHENKMWTIKYIAYLTMALYFEVNPTITVIWYHAGDVMPSKRLTMLYAGKSSNF
jgi:hypothetical protein